MGAMQNSAEKYFFMWLKIFDRPEKTAKSRRRNKSDFLCTVLIVITNKSDYISIKLNFFNVPNPP